MEYKKIILNRSFYIRDTSRVAKDLLGKVLVKESGGNKVSGIIVETEAYYGPGDPASHASGGPTPRSRVMFGKAGIAYVYLCYGVYWLLNIVTEEKTIPGAVLIRGYAEKEKDRRYRPKADRWSRKAYYCHGYRLF
jgi:DNA-3-methyladenine glycosylase